MANKVQFAQLEERINNVNLWLDLGLTKQLERDKVPMFSDRSSISTEDSIKSTPTSSDSSQSIKKTQA